jgi:hypothetical protein
MEIQSFRTLILRILINALLIDLAIAVAVGAVCMILRLATLYYYGLFLMMAGLGLIVLRFLSVTGSWTGERNYYYLFGRSVSENSINERAVGSIRNNFAAYRFFFQLLAVGILPMVVGTLLQLYFR